MRRTLLGVCAVTASIVMTGCADILLPDSSAGNTSLVAENTNPKSARTRTSVAETEGDDIQIHWTQYDQLGVFGNHGTSNALFSNSNKDNSPTATFIGNLNPGETPAAAYYPYNPLSGSDPSALRGYLTLRQEFDPDTREIEGDYKIGVPNADGSFSFRHIFAFLKFDVDATGSTLDGQKLEKIEMTIDGSNLGGHFTFNARTGEYESDATENNPTLTMTWKNEPVMTEAFEGYMSVAPVDLTNKKIKVVITTSTHRAGIEVTPAIASLDANTYYTLPLTIKILEENKEKYGWYCESLTPTEENASWVSGLQSQLACANRVFSLPGNPFMHKIRVEEGLEVARVYNLPEGLYWNDTRKLVYGTAPAAEGEYIYTVVVNKNGQEAFREGIKFTVSNSLHQPTPHMGWQSWNVLDCNISEDIIKGVADALVTNGYKDAGYTWLGIDDSWQDLSGARYEDGMAKYNIDKFPNGLKTVTDYIHSKGLNAGIYSDAGTLTCASGDQAGGTALGAYGYESVHARYFTEWGFDKLKEDWFWKGHGDNDGKLDPSSTETAYELYGKMGAGIKDAGGKILLSMCEWGLHEPWKWGPEAGASSWRMSKDHRDGWLGKNNGSSDGFVNNGDVVGIGLKNSIYMMRDLWPYAGVNRFNDPDMLVVGIRGGGKSSNDLVEGVTKSSNWLTGEVTYKKDGKIYTGMTDAEYETEFAMWCMWSAPLLLTIDVRSSGLNEHDVNLLKNADLIALDQDKLGQQAEYIKAVGDVWYFCKDLADGGCAIAAVNLGDSQAQFAINFDDYQALDFNKEYSTRELISRMEGIALKAGRSISGNLPAHGTVVYRMTAK